MPVSDTFLRIDGQAVVVSSGQYDQRFTLVSRRDGPAPHLAAVVVFSEHTASGYELTYEIATGRVVDVDDAAVEQAKEVAHA